MALKNSTDRSALERLLLSRLPRKEISALVQSYTQPYRELMSYYRCAMMEVETKFNVLNEELSLQYDRNPIESIKTRLKSPESIAEKLQRRGFPLTVESIEENLNDIAGVRVICSFPSDIYRLAEAFLHQKVPIGSVSVDNGHILRKHFAQKFTSLQIVFHDADSHAGFGELFGQIIADGASADNDNAFHRRCRKGEGLEKTNDIVPCRNKGDGVVFTEDEAAVWNIDCIIAFHCTDQNITS